jgi:threonine dehydrogenase-like Zn-dependent dehydrogenase
MAAPCRSRISRAPFAAALGEPFAVALHAVARAGALIDRRVLVTGSGPIGTLVVLAARLHGARDIVATDVVDAPLAKAEQMGADRALNMADEPEAMTAYEQNKGSFDIMFEASGNEKAPASGIRTLKPRSVLVQIGLGGAMNLPQDQIVAKELEVRGSFRFDEEFGLAAALIGSGRADVKPLVHSGIRFRRGGRRVRNRKRSNARYESATRLCRRALIRPRKTVAALSLRMASADRWAAGAIPTITPRPRAS